jgi:hypothetical protein
MFCSIRYRDYERQYDELTNKIEETRQAKMNLLKNANLPLPGLSVEDNQITYNGQKWDNMSGSEQLQVATAIVRKLNPNCGFVLIDKLEQMDSQTLYEFGQWLEEQGLQAIGTRVSTGDECSIIIEDGMIKGQEYVLPGTSPTMGSFADTPTLQPATGNAVPSWKTGGGF